MHMGICTQRCEQATAVIPTGAALDAVDEADKSQRLKLKQNLFRLKMQEELESFKKKSRALGADRLKRKEIKHNSFNGLLKCFGFLLNVNDMLKLILSSKHAYSLPDSDCFNIL